MNIWANVFNLICEAALILYFFRRLPSRENSRSRFAPLVLLAFALVYFSSAPLQEAAAVFSLSNLLFQTLRCVYHIAVVFVYLMLAKEIAIKKGLYISCIYTVIYMVTLNVRLIIQDITDVQSLSPVVGFFVNISHNPILLLLLIIALKFIRFEKIDKIEIYNFVFQAIWLFLTIYFKWAMLTGNITSDIGLPFSTYVAFSLIASMAVYVVMIMYEYNQFVKKKNVELQVERVTMQYEMQNLNREKRTNEDIRRLHHDMKNHLLAIKTLNGNNEEIDDYLKQLIDDLEPYESNIKTGNETVDAIISEKNHRGKLDHIEMNVCMDLSSLSYLNPADLVCIFGNALDNAVEALKKVKSENKIIYMKSTKLANYTVIRVSNQFSGTIHEEGGRILTEKEDKENHGIGLYSIKKSVEKYGGNIKTSFDNEKGWFRLIIMLPEANPEANF